MRNWVKTAACVFSCFLLVVFFVVYCCTFIPYLSIGPMMLLHFSSPLTPSLALWTRKVLCGSFLCAIYKFSFIHSFIHCHDITWKWPIKVRNLKPFSLFVFFFALVCERIFIKTHSIENRCYKKIYCLQARPCTIQPRKFYRLWQWRG